MNGAHLPKRVLMSADTVGGVWNYALELARRLGERNIRVGLAAMGTPLRPDQRREAEAVATLTVFESRCKLEWMCDPWDDIRRTGEWLRDLEDDFLPDVVHLNHFAHGCLNWKSPVLVVGHSCVLSWCEAVRGGLEPDAFHEYRGVVSRGLQGADLVAAPTASMLWRLEAHYGALRDRRVIPNGRDAAFFSPRPKEPIVLSAGRIWDAAKNMEDLDRVAPHIPWPIFSAGEDRHPDGGRVCCGNLRLLGCLSPPELAQWYGRAAVYAHPARYEPFGLTVLEAALSGCALVLGDIPSLRETWEDAAIFVVPGDVEGLAAALRSLAASETYRSSLGMSARVRALEFTPERMVSGYLKVYGELIQRKRISRPEPAHGAEAESARSETR